MFSILSQEDFLKISEYINRKSGIYLEEEKHYDKLAKYIDKRLKELEADSFREYFFKLRFADKENTEFQELMNAMTVNETYFFREKEQFEVLVNTILPELHKNTPFGKPLRILSSPCSTGEEPYSILLHIVEEGSVVKERDIEIVGIDIDSNVIRKAQTAQYSNRSVHAIPKSILSKWFTKKTTAYELEEELQGKVNFQVANIFDRVEMEKLGKFDVIFSRNMFIYFDDASRKEVAITFYDMLRPGGYVFLGHAEYMSRIVSIFTLKKVDKNLIYQK